MKLTTSGPALREDFFPRDDEVNEVWFHAQRGNVLILAPCKVGKTSLLKHIEHNPREGWRCLYLSVAEVETEKEFVFRLATLLYKAHPNRTWRSQLRRSLREMRRTTSERALPFEEELRYAVEINWQGVGTVALESLDAASASTLLLIDEIPMMINRLLARKSTDQYAGRAYFTTKSFLHWFREKRNALPGRVRYVLAGSVGLDSVVGRERLSSTIDDLQPLPFAPLDRDRAHEMLVRLADGEGLSLPKPVRERFLVHVDWAIPYHLQLMFRSLLSTRGEAREEVVPIEVDRAVEALLSDEHRGCFEHWADRLIEGTLPAGQIELARALLAAASGNPTGINRETVDEIRQTTAPGIPAGPVLASLEHDGYLVFRGESWCFVSSLLRRWWQRNFRPEAKSLEDDLSWRTSVHTLRGATYEWDPRKATMNLQKHGVDFADAALVLEDEWGVTLPDSSAANEERFSTLGRDPNGKILVVAYTYRGDRVRLISARKAERREQRQYFERDP